MVLEDPAEVALVEDKEAAAQFDLEKRNRTTKLRPHPSRLAMSTGERAKEMFPNTSVALVAGGFHLRSAGEEEIRRIAADLERLGVRRIGPSHCTGDAAKRIFLERWGKSFVSFDLGDTYRF